MPISLSCRLSDPAAAARSFATVLDKIQRWGTSCFPARGEKFSMIRPARNPMMKGTDPAPADPKAGAIVAPPDSGPEISTGAGVEASGEERALDVGRAGPEERRYEWANRHRPIALKDFICNRDRAEELRELVIKQHCSHFIFEGPPGVGKRTMVLAFLREVFGPEKIKTKNELKKIELKGELNTSIDVNMKISNKHVEVNLAEASGYEKHVIVTMINEFQRPLKEAEECDHTNCRAIVLLESGKLSRDAQHYIRWVMEKHKGCNKIFFCCNDASKLRTIKNLCKTVKLQPPSNTEIVEVLEFIATRERIELPHHLANKIAINSEHNLRQAIRSFEASWKSNYSFKENQEILTGWEDDIAKIARNTIQEQSPKQLYIIREELKKLTEHNVSPDFVLRTLVVELKKHLDEHFQAKLDALYQEYKTRDERFLLGGDESLESLGSIQENSGDSFHDPRKNGQRFMRIEEFAAKFMSKYKCAIGKHTSGSNCC